MRTQIGKQSIRSLFLPILIGLLALPLPAASNKWSRVSKIESDTYVYIGLAGDQYLEGRFFDGNNEAMTIRAGSRGNMILPCASVLWIAVDSKGRRWFSIPLAVVAGAAGCSGGYSIANHASCSDTREVCSRAKDFIIGMSAVSAAGIAYYLSRGPSKKVIYEKP